MDFLEDSINYIWCNFSSLIACLVQFKFQQKGSWALVPASIPSKAEVSFLSLRFKKLMDFIYPTKKQHDPININGFENNKCTAAIFVDLKGVFDNIWREALIVKLHEIGVQGKRECLKACTVLHCTG